MDSFPKIGFLFWVAHLCLLPSVWAQELDSVEVSGKLIWEDKTITGFPAQLEITSTYDSTFSKEVPIDSLGGYKVRLVEGTYTLAPQKHYHWIGEEYIRINDQASKISLSLSAKKDVEAPPIKLTTIPWPDLMPEEGVLHNFTPEKALLLDEFIERHMAFFEIPGASIALIKKGELIYHKIYGVKNSITRAPIEDRTLFEAGSVTKPIFAFLVMRLSEKGIIDLDKPLFQYLPFEAVAHDERYKEITARLVLSHQTGFSNWPKRDEKGQFDLKFKPGTQFGYSGEAFEYLKRVVAHVTQRDISTLLQEELLSPLKWEHVYFQGGKEITQYAANGHYDYEPREIRHIKQPMMAYSMSTEAKSFSRFMLALRNRDLLMPETYEEMLTPISTRADGVQWSLGFRIENSPEGLVYGHSGSTSRGFICNFSFFEDLDLGYVMFTNSQMGGFLSIPLLTEFLVTGKKDD